MSRQDAHDVFGVTVRRHGLFQLVLFVLFQA